MSTAAHLELATLEQAKQHGIRDEEFEKINNDLNILSAQIGKFIAYLEDKKKNKEFIKK